MTAVAQLRTAYEVAASVTDPELPMLTLKDLGVLRGVEQEGDVVVVTITPTYSGCPALVTMQQDLVRALREAGHACVVRLSLAPAWSSDWITPRGREALARHGISPPGPRGPDAAGPTPLSLQPTRRRTHCPHCGSADVVLLSEFAATACRALYRCHGCREPFEHVKEI